MLVEDGAECGAGEVLAGGVELVVEVDQLFGVGAEGLGVEEFEPGVFGECCGDLFEWGAEDFGEAFEDLQPGESAAD